MSISAKRNARGELNGKWFVEVMVAGVRRRGTAETLPEAKAMEAAFKAQQPCVMASGRVNEVPTVYMISQLRQEARVVWRGTKDEKQSIARFDAICSIFGDHTNIRHIRTRELDDLVNVLRGRGLVDGTVHRYLATFSAALRWAHKREIIDGMPFVPWPDQSKPREHILTPDQSAALFKELERASGQAHLIYRILLSTGMRIGELLGAKEEHLDLDAGIVRLVDTKNGDNREVPVPAELLKEWSMAFATGGFMSYRQLNTISHRAGKVVGLSFKLTPHVARHTAVTRLEAAGVGLKTIGRLVGHRSIKTTARYAHPSTESLKSAVKVLSS